MEFIESLSHAQHVAHMLGDGGLAAIIDFFLSADGYYFFVLFFPIGVYLFFYSIFHDGIGTLVQMLKPTYIACFLILVSLYGHCLIGWDKCEIGELRGLNFIYNWGAFIVYFPFVVLTRTWVFLVGFLVAVAFFLEEDVAYWSFMTRSYKRLTFHVTRFQRLALLFGAIVALIVIADSVWFLTVFLSEKLLC